MYQHLGLYYDINGSLHLVLLGKGTTMRVLNLEISSFRTVILDWLSKDFRFVRVRSFLCGYADNNLSFAGPSVRVQFRSGFYALIIDRKSLGFTLEVSLLRNRLSSYLFLYFFF